MTRAGDEGSGQLGLSSGAASGSLGSMWKGQPAPSSLGVQADSSTIEPGRVVKQHAAEAGQLGLFSDNSTPY